MRFDRQLLLEHFGDLWPVYNHGFTAMLIECRKHFNGDMDQLMIMSVIGERTLTRERASGLTYDDFVAGQRSPGLPKRINLQSIADSTGIPRETARRKVRKLIKRGWIEKDPDGSFRVSENAVAELQPATELALGHLFDIGRAMLYLNSTRTK